MTGEKRLVLFDFDEQADQRPWRSIDDVVMGGVSASKFYIAPEGVGVFEGVLSLERGGGFASVRSQPAQMDLSAYGGLEIRVGGDGKRYRLRLRADPEFDGVAYQVGFETDAGVWQLKRFSFDRFRPTFRGRDVPDAPPLNIDTIMSFGWMIADKQAGPFRLEIDWICAYADGAR
jgi:monofunctional biosynthetic peptidoglycan transglycosylase